VKQILQVLAELENGPAHCHDIADETGLSYKAASAYLTELRYAWLIEAVGYARVHNAGRKATIYALIAPRVNV
jgi:predicted transcriptional regulator